MAIYDDKWFEVWYSDGAEVLPAHILLVTPDPKSSTEVLIIDPFKKNEIVYRAKDYQDARWWLNEDEYEEVEGRQFPDDGW